MIKKTYLFAFKTNLPLPTTQARQALIISSIKDYGSNQYNFISDRILFHKT
ncbi:hypothetical protein [Dapis sp. BLCC M126]|uniref:hypothetical protein n=1 Tax=Dapis sp. BLCC M126 TaxID=3400189 RepID=UPI003CEFBB0A